MAQRRRILLEENSSFCRTSIKGDGEPHEIEETIVGLFCRFYEKFGRPPRTNEPVFFDPDADEPMPLQEQAAKEMWDRLADTMVREGEMSPGAGYAMKTTGLLVTPDTEHLLTECQRREWNAALAECQTAYSSASGGEDAKRKPLKASPFAAREIPSLNCSRSDRSKLSMQRASRPEQKHS